MVALGYVAVAAILYACSKYAEIAPKPVEMPHGHGLEAAE